MKTIHLPYVDSTNTYLKENYQNLDNYTFVSCDEQSSGRGRNNRQWKSENGKNLMFSLLILSKDLIAHFKDVSLVCAISIGEVLEEIGLNNISIKWPNDVYVGDKKICGILLEAITKKEIECLIVGIGLNINQEEFVGEFITEPTSIINELNKEIDLNEIKQKVYKKLINNLDAILENKNFYLYINNHDYLKNKEAFAQINNEIKKIKIVSINKDYSLKVLIDGKEKNMEAGEISFHNKK